MVDVDIFESEEIKPQSNPLSAISSAADAWADEAPDPLDYHDCGFLPADDGCMSDGHDDDGDSDTADGGTSKGKGKAVSTKVDGELLSELGVGSGEGDGERKRKKPGPFSKEQQTQLKELYANFVKLATEMAIVMDKPPKTVLNFLFGGPLPKQRTKLHNAYVRIYFFENPRPVGGEYFVINEVPLLTIR